MLNNGYSSSGGDALPWFFRKQGVGPLVGTRTWGGLIGLSGNPEFVDGGSVDVPTFRIYDPDGRWVVENVGVAPDVEVFDVPERRVNGGDPSLEKGAELLLDALAKRSDAGVKHLSRCALRMDSTRANPRDVEKIHVPGAIVLGNAP